MKFGIDVNAFLETLPLMGKGMLGIFVVTLVIVGSMMILNKMGSSDNEQ